MTRLLAFLLVIALTPRALTAQAAADSAAIRATALDYIEGWYTGDATRMERALHPDLAKRIVRPHPENKNFSRLDNMSALSLIQGTRRGGGQSSLFRPS